MKIIGPMPVLIVSSDSDDAEEPSNNSFISESQTFGSPVKGNMKKIILFILCTLFFVYIYIYICIYIYIFMLCAAKKRPSQKYETKSESADGQREMAKEVDDFLQKFRVRNFVKVDQNNKCLIPPKMVRIPDDDLLARSLDPTLVGMLLKSMVCKGIHDPNVYGIIFEQGFECHDIVDATTYPLDIQSMVGMHTSHAIKEGNARYPTNEKFWFTPATLICCPDTPYNRKMVAAWGNIQNQITAITKQMSHWDYLSQLRIKFLHLEDRRVSGIDAKQLRIETTDVIKTYSQMWNIPTPSVQQYWGIASKEENIWNLLSKIFRGQVTQNSTSKFKIPKSVSHFTMMAKIPPADLTRWLTAIVGGDPTCSTTQAFFTICKRFKKSQAVVACILKYVNIKHTVCSEKIKTIQQLYECLPTLQMNNWFQSQVDVCPDNIKSAHTLPASVKSSVDTAVTHQESTDQVGFFCFTMSYDKNNIIYLFTNTFSNT